MAQVRLVGRDCVDREVLGGRAHERAELRAVGPVSLRDLDARHDVRLDADRDVRLEELPVALCGRRAEAGQTLQSTLARTPEDSLTHANQGWALLEARDYPKAMEHFKEALRRTEPPEYRNK